MKASRVDDLENEKTTLEKEISILREEVAEKRCLKDRVINKGKFVVDKASKFSQQLVECEHALNQNRENAREAEKKVIALTKEKVAALLKIDAAKVEAIEAYKKTDDFAKDSERHLMSKIFKVYGDLVTQIRGVQADFPVDRVKGFPTFLRF